MLAGIAYGIFMNLCTAGVSYLVARKDPHRALLAYWAAFVCGVLLIPPFMIWAGSAASSSGERDLLEEGVGLLGTMAVVVTPLFGPWALSIFASDRAHAKVIMGNGQGMVEVTGLRAGSREAITIAMTDREWRRLPPVRRAIRDSLLRRGLPLADSPANSTPAFASDATAWEEVGGRVFKSGGWVFVTGRRVDTGAIETISIPLGRWDTLEPVEQLVSEAVRRGVDPQTTR